MEFEYIYININLINLIFMRQGGKICIIFKYINYMIIDNTEDKAEFILKKFKIIQNMCTKNI